jgi:hypothetical protein
MYAIQLKNYQNNTNEIIGYTDTNDLNNISNKVELTNVINIEPDKFMFEDVNGYDFEQIITIQDSNSYNVIEKSSEKVNNKYKIILNNTYELVKKYKLVPINVTSEQNNCINHDELYEMHGRILIVGPLKSGKTTTSNIIIENSPYTITVFEYPMSRSDTLRYNALEDTILESNVIPCALDIDTIIFMKWVDRSIFKKVYGMYAHRMPVFNNITVNEIGIILEAEKVFKTQNHFILRLKPV